MWINLVCGSKEIVIVEEGAFRNLARCGTGLKYGPCQPSCMDSDTQNQPFTVSALMVQEIFRVHSSHGVGVSVENSEKTDVGLFRRVLVLEKDTRPIVSPVAVGERLQLDAPKRSIIMNRQNLFNGTAKDASQYKDHRTVLTSWIVHPKSCSSGGEDASHIQD